MKRRERISHFIIASSSREQTPGMALKRRRKLTWCLVLLPLAAAGSADLCSAQTLETETALLLPKGEWKVGAAYERQTSSEGTEAAGPLIVEYGLADRLELVVEPILYTAIRPKEGVHATGVGDLETTLVWRFHDASRRSPALALAAEVKIPTARNELIGTRKADYALYGIATRRMGRFDGHVNVSYTFVGRPAGVEVKNLFGYALAGTFHLTPRWDAFAEFTGNTSALGSAETPDTAPGGNENPVSPELAGEERVGTVGLGFYTRPGLLLFGSVSYDNQHATLLRLGYTWRFQ
jgi:Putative MetA-pathway of phenol degradation